VVALIVTDSQRVVTELVELPTRRIPLPFHVHPLMDLLVVNEIFGIIRVHRPRADFKQVRVVI